MDILTVGVHIRHLHIHEALVVNALLLALVNFPQLRAKFLDYPFEPLRQVVDRLSDELPINDLFLIELAPIWVTLGLLLLLQLHLRLHVMLMLVLVLMLMLKPRPPFYVAGLLAATDEAGSALVLAVAQAELLL